MQKRALLIGINEYPLVGNLSYARQDAEAVRSSLLQYYGFTENELFLMTENERAEHSPTQRFIERQLQHITGSITWASALH